MFSTFSEISTFFDFAVMIWNCATDLSPLTIHTTYLRKKKFKFHSMIRWLTCIWFPIIILECLYHFHFHEIISLLHLKTEFELLSNIKISIWLLENFNLKRIVKQCYCALKMIYIYLFRQLVFLIKISSSICYCSS